MFDPSVNDKRKFSLLHFVVKPTLFMGLRYCRGAIGELMTGEFKDKTAWTIKRITDELKNERPQNTKTNELLDGAGSILALIVENDTLYKEIFLEFIRKCNKYQITEIDKTELKK